VLQASVAALAAAGVEAPESVAAQLLAEAYGCRPLELPLHRTEVPSAEVWARFSAWERRARAHEPVAYILSRVEFLGREFRTDPRALIPRPDTERLVEAVLADRALRALPTPRVADVGTGSGCVAVSLALEWPAAQLVAVDRSAQALELARENAARLGVEVRVAWVRADLLDGFEARSLDAVVANLPYIPAGEMAALPASVRDYEPREALDGGADGLEPIRRLAAQAANVLRPGGCLFLEIGYDQGAATCALLEAAGFAGVRVSRDYGGRDRVVTATCGGGTSRACPA
jgi:release factor glutamine methyltransferase